MYTRRMFTGRMQEPFIFTYELRHKLFNRTLETTRAPNIKYKHDKFASYCFVLESMHSAVAVSFFSSYNVMVITSSFLWRFSVSLVCSTLLPAQQSWHSFLLAYPADVSLSSVEDCHQIWDSSQVLMPILRPPQPLSEPVVIKHRLSEIFLNAYGVDMGPNPSILFLCFKTKTFLHQT